MNNFSLMARFNAWANARLYDAVAELPDAAYRADNGVFFGSVHHTLNHLLIVDRLWTGRIAKVDRGVRSLDDILYDDFDSLRTAHEMESAQLIELVDGLSAGALRGAVTYRRIIGEGTHVTRRDHMLLTLYNHQTHHRGQVHAVLTRSGITPPPLDVIYYLEEVGLS